MGKTSVLLWLRLSKDCVIMQANNSHATFSPLETDWTVKKMASNLDYAEDIEEAKAYMAKKNVFQLFEVREIMSLCFRTIRCSDQLQIPVKLWHRRQFNISFAFSVLVSQICMSGKVISLEILKEVFVYLKDAWRRQHFDHIRGGVIIKFDVFFFSARLREFGNCDCERTPQFYEYSTM